MAKITLRQLLRIIILDRYMKYLETIFRHLNIRESAQKENHFETAALYDKIGKIDKMQENYTEALEY